MSQPNRGNQHLKKKKKKPWAYNHLNPAAIRNLAPTTYNLKQKFTSFTAKFVAPHHDEPEDLTDDLAPKVNAPKAPIKQPAAQTAAQPSSAGTDSKLNFKFQKTKPQTPDWSKYQNNFKRLSAASPDTDPEEMLGENEQKPQSISDQQAKNTEVNTGFDEDVEMKEARELTTTDLSVAVTIEPFQYITSEQVRQIADALASRIQDAILKRKERRPLLDMGLLQGSPLRPVYSHRDPAIFRRSSLHLGGLPKARLRSVDAIRELSSPFGHQSCKKCGPSTAT